MDKDFNEFWDAYQPDENRFPRRRAATFRAWNERTPAARKAMLAKVKAEGAPKWKNPYFYVADFPEPEPYNWNGDPRIEAMMRTGTRNGCKRGAKDPRTRRRKRRLKVGTTEEF